jgi:hypothetical protein
MILCYKLLNNELLKYSRSGASSDCWTHRLFADGLPQLSWQDGHPYYQLLGLCGWRVPHASSCHRRSCCTRVRFWAQTLSSGPMPATLRASDRVASGRCRPEALTDPYVLALEQTVPQPTDSPPPKGPRGYPSESRRHTDEPRCVRHVSLSRVCRLTPRFPPQGPPWRVSLLHGYYQGAMTSCRPFHRISLPSLGGTSAFTRSFRSPADECAAEAWSCYPGIWGRDFAAETTGSRKFLGKPNYPFAHVQSTPAGLRAPDHCGVAA